MIPVRQPCITGQAGMSWSGTIYPYPVATWCSFPNASSWRLPVILVVLSPLPLRLDLG